MEIINPEDWKSPIGYSNGIKVPLTGHAIYIAGQVGWNADQIFESEELLPQFELALKNVLSVLEKAGGEPHHICRMTAYCCDKPQYLLVRRELGALWRKLMGKHFPAMSMIFVSDLLDHPGKIELEATAIIAAQ